MTRILILITGTAGLGIALRAAGYYKGVDSFAFGITLVMICALVAGVTELLIRATRVGGLRRDLDDLVAKAEKKSPKDLSAASGDLRSLLRSHLERDPMPTRAPLFTPYLVGLLVMLGLLGTFLGLFETLRGAREALSTSADVDALRAGLSTPMSGLMRSFGTSAAGVACSAMLGLGAVFVRRAARELDQAVHHACAHSLSHLSAARRQLTALVALAEQGESLPAAATALRDAVAELRTLREEAAESAKARREAAAAEAAALTEAVDGKLQLAVDQFAKVEEGVRSAQQETLEQLQADANARATQQREHAEAFTAAVGDKLTLAVDQFARTEERVQASQAETLKQLKADADARASEQREHWQKASAQLASSGEVLREGLGGAAAAVREGWDRLSATFESAQKAGRDGFEERSAALLDRIGSLEQAWREGHESATHEVRKIMVEGIAEASKAAGETVEPTVARIVEATERSAAAHLDALRSQLEQEGEMRRTRDAENLKALREHMDQVSASLEQARAQRGEADSALLERMGDHMTGMLAALEKTSSERAASDQSLLGEFASHAQELRSAETERTESLMSRWKEVAEHWQAAMASGAERDEKRGAELAAVATTLEGKLERATEAMLERLSTQEQADNHHRERTEAMVKVLEQTTARVQESSQAVAERSAQYEQSAATRLEQLMNAFDAASQKQAERLVAFEETLSTRQQEGAEMLREQLASEAHELGQELANTGAMVRDAASLVQSSGAELSAAAEMFTGAVEQHGEAAQRWLSGLSLVERSVEEAGEEAAVEVLGQYLTRTHELFDQQLGFQQELFEQLQAARGAQVADA